MDREEVFEGVREVICASLGVQPIEVLPESNLMGDLDADSLDLVDIVMETEKKFRVDITDAQVDDVGYQRLTVATLVDLTLESYEREASTEQVSMEEEVIADKVSLDSSHAGAASPI